VPSKEEEGLAAHLGGHILVVVVVAKLGAIQKDPADVASRERGHLQEGGSAATCQQSETICKKWVLQARINVASAAGHNDASSTYMHFTEESRGTFPLSTSLDKGMTDVSCVSICNGSPVMLVSAANGSVQRLLLNHSSASPLLLQQLPCSHALQPSNNTNTVCGQCDVTQVAVHGPSGYAAASVTSSAPGIAGRDTSAVGGGAVVIWRQQVTLRSTAHGGAEGDLEASTPVIQSSSHFEMSAATASLSTSCSEVWLAEELVEEAWLRLKESVCCLSWVTAAGIMPLLAIALESGKR
jgi:hypothetical protein